VAVPVGVGEVVALGVAEGVEVRVAVPVEVAEEVGVLVVVFEGVAVLLIVIVVVGVFVLVPVGDLVAVGEGVEVGELVRVLVAVFVAVLVGVEVETTVTGGQVGLGVAIQVETAAPQALVPQDQLESRLGQESVVKDQAVPPTIPVAVTAQPLAPIILVSKVGTSGPDAQLISPPNSPIKTG
jgi:hypothetical protein